jgi:hypothetical protein
VKSLFLFIVLSFFWINVSLAESSWIKFPLQGDETANFNIKTSKEFGPNQYIVEQVFTKNNKKNLYEKNSIETLVRFCGKKVGLYNAPKKLLSRGKITNFNSKTSSGIKPGEIEVFKGGVVLFEIPYIDIEGSVHVFCMPASYKGKMQNLYTPEKEKIIIRDNIQRLYQENTTERYIDCRRNMWGNKLSDKVHWIPLKPGSNGEIWNTELCKILDD